MSHTPAEQATDRPHGMTRWRPDTVRTGPSRDDVGLFGQPRGLPWMLGVEMFERFSYYGMRAILLYFIIDTIANGGLGIDKNTGVVILAAYGAAVYLLAIPGGIFADRIIGPWRSTLYGGLVIMAGHICLSLPTAATAWLGICLVAVGTGFIKPNLSTIVGGLYDKGDPRRDAGFQYFYMSINIGSLVSPLITAWLKDHYGYHVGFIAAAVGMALALVAFVVGRGKLSQFAFDVPNPLKPGEGKRLALGSLAVVAACAALLLIFRMIFGDLASAIAYMLFAVATIASITYFVIMLRSREVTSRERSHLLAYIPLWIGAVLFFMIFEQAAGKMALFAKFNTDGHTPFGWVVSPETYQSVNPLAVVILAPIIGWFFTRRAGKFPSTVVKFAISVTIIGLSALLLGWGFGTWPGEDKLAPFWFLAAVFVMQTVAELFLSPVGLSATTALAPKRFASQAMSLWLLASATGQGIAAVVIERTADVPNSTYYYILGIATLVVAVLLFLVAPWVQRKMADVNDPDDVDTTDTHEEMSVREA